MARDVSHVRLASAPGPIEALRALPASGLTVRDVARRYRVSEDKVRAWVRRGELRAINTAATLCGKPRWVITPEALAEFEKGRCGSPPPKPQRRPRQQTFIDFYP
jgi:excisionase family DNA binding protein